MANGKTFSEVENRYTYRNTKFQAQHLTFIQKFERTPFQVKVHSNQYLPGHRPHTIQLHCENIDNPLAEIPASGPLRIDRDTMHNPQLAEAVRFIQDSIKNLWIRVVPSEEIAGESTGGGISESSIHILIGNPKHSSSAIMNQPFMSPATAEYFELTVDELKRLVPKIQQKIEEGRSVEIPDPKDPKFFGLFADARTQDRLARRLLHETGSIGSTDEIMLQAEQTGTNPKRLLGKWAKEEAATSNKAKDNPKPPAVNKR